MRKNDRIRAPEVRVIGADGKQIGVISTREAIRQAQVLGLDLIEVSPGSMPPVCRIADYGKFMYDLGKKQKDHKAHTSKLKEVKFRPRIEQHDYITKLRHAEEFLFEGNKVKMTSFSRAANSNTRIWASRPSSARWPIWPTWVWPTSRRACLAAIFAHAFTPAAQQAQADLQFTRRGRTGCP